MQAFTASQLARTLGKTRQAVSNALEKRPHVVLQPCEDTGFQTANGWTLDSLPDAMKATLARMANTGGYRSVSDLILSSPQKFVASTPLAEVGPEILQRAASLRGHFAPILRQSDRLSLREMASRAHLSIARGGELRLENQRTLRDRISRVIDRAGRRSDFDNIDIYVEEFLKPSGEEAPASRSSNACPNLAFSLREYSEENKVLCLGQIFEASRKDFDALKERIGQRKAKAKILNLLAASGIDFAPTRNALRVRLDTVFSRMDDGLAGIELIHPPSIRNRGGAPLATLNDEELKEARRLYIQLGSRSAALRMLAANPICRQEVADVILMKRSSKHAITPTLHAQLSAIPQAVRDYYKSPTKVKREAFITPRTKTFLTSRGEQEILPGMLCERDDMSNNFIFWIDWPWGGDPCSEKYGVRIARGQNLMHIDVGSLRFLSRLMLVRQRDSYRADDIWQWVGQTYRDLGIPEIGERWERGIWQAKKLQGDPTATFEPGHTDQEARLGGIKALGRQIIVSQSPTTKIIENRFRYFQRVCNTIPGQIGASRGEMEKVNKLWTECRQGRRDPRDYFLSYPDACAQIDAKIQWVNSEPVEGAIYNGIPHEIWQREGGDQRMTRLRPEQAYLFSRDRTVVTVTKGHALMRVTAPDKRRQAWYFYQKDLWRFEGHKVALYLDKYAPDAGATIVQAEGRDINQLIGHAEFVDGCPQFALGLAVGTDDTRGADALDRRKAFTNAVQADYRALGLTHTIAKGTYASDGRGASKSVERNSQPNFRETSADEAFEKAHSARISDAEMDASSEAAEKGYFELIRQGRESLPLDAGIVARYTEFEKRRKLETASA